ncbi:chitin synthase chs-2-like [Mytilus galloprovincialis]|uniref:chitin synthase chs-2-like n=1 Tax=Mytilus galloprovincialis TaxID=29158 RepID=UPI003F7CD29C
MEETPQCSHTPYGGQMTLVLPGKTKVCIHLKDSTKIRKKKRWSQVMYMHYLLDHCSKVNTNMSKEGRTIPEENKKYTYKLENTFIMALDGDVEFQPEAVPHLLQRMRKYPDVGAACGRIHPAGKGPIVWYQKFEYAVSHWLQKATEHVIGCVLCSPGCFSLFRGSDLKEILEDYSNQPTEALDVLQYDQGEDRWLCTLLLKAGKRIEYCAESDAKTFVPETFEEFFKQRRRWIPSTLANIFYLIMNMETVCKKNNKITRLYIIYQVLYCISSLLTPGTIIMMMYGALVLVLGHNGEGITGFILLFVILLPVTVFVCISLFKKDIQMMCAQIVSFILFVLMVLVIAGVIRSAVEETLCSTSIIFVCFIAGIFVIATILHPKECHCVKHSLLYFLAIPCTSIVLFLYSIANMDDVNWGTREREKPSNSSEGGKKEKETTKLCTVQLPHEEKIFWEETLRGCLKPTSDNEDTEMVTKLHVLRNHSLILVLILNTLAVILMFSLEYTSSISNTLSVQIPCKSNYIIIKPISFMFSIVFGILLCIQFIMMLFHRWTTMLHVLSTTDIFTMKKDTN